MNTDIDVLSDAVKIIRRREGDEATSSEQNAKRRQRAGRLIINRTRQKSDLGEPSYFDKVIRGRDRVKRMSAARASFERVKGDGFQGPITESQQRVLGM